jgi:hypothetical protein
MTSRSYVRAGLAALLGVGAGCSDSTTPAGPGPEYGLPALARPGAIYQGPGGYYILYADGAFTARFGYYGLHGRYEGPASAITFRFDVERRWTAAGTLRGDTLTVTLDEAMSLADFPSGVYVRVPDAR